MNKPLYQRIIESYISWFIAVFLFLGSVLDSLINTIELISPQVTYIGTLLILIFSWITNYILRTRSVHWVLEDGTSVQIKKLGIKPKVIFLSLIVTLWFPIFLEIPSAVSSFQLHGRDKITVIIAPFDGNGDIKPEARIEKHLKENLETLPDLSDVNIEINPEPIKGVNGEKVIDSIYNQYDSVIIIWGWYDEIGITANFDTNIKRDVYLSGGFTPALEEVLNLNSAPDSYVFYIARELPQEVTYLTLLTLSQLYFAKEEYEFAAEYLQKSLINLPDDIEEYVEENLYANLIYYYWLSSQTNSASELSDKIIQEFPDSNLGYINRALNHEVDALLDYLDRMGIKKLNIGDTELGNVSLYTISTDEMVPPEAYKSELALQDYNYVIENFPDDRITSYAYLRRAYQLYSIGKKNEAYADLELAAVVNPSAEDIYFLKAQFYKDIFDNQRAIEDFEKYLSLKPQLSDEEMVSILTDLGYLNYGLGRYEEAVSNFTSAISIDEDNSELYRHRGDSYRAALKNELASDDYRESIQIDPFNLNAFLGLGSIFIFEKRPIEYISTIEFALHHGKGFSEEQKVDIYRQLGFAYYGIYEYKTAAQYFSSAILINEEDSELYRHRGDAYAAAGENDDALRDFTKSLQIDPDNANGYLSRGRLYYMLGDKKNSLADLNKYLDLSNDAAFRELVKKIIQELKMQP